jgi:hypothetical protein
MTDQHSEPDAGTPVARRVMLATLGIGTAGIAAAPILQRGWESALATASQYDPTKLTELLPNPGGFRYYSVADSVPHKDATNYQLTVDGLVDRPRAYTLDELHALPHKYSRIRPPSRFRRRTRRPYPEQADEDVRWVVPAAQHAVRKRRETTGINRTIRTRERATRLAGLTARSTSG